MYLTHSTNPGFPDMERPYQAPHHRTWRVLNRAGSPPQEASRPLFFCRKPRAVFPPERPVAISIRPERRAEVKGAPLFGAAKRTFDGEHRSGTRAPVDGRRSGNTFPLVSLEWVLFWTAGPMTAQMHTRRLITLIFAGRNRMVMIRREPPRTERAGWVLKPFRIGHVEDSPFRGPCAVVGSAVQ
jgi:hypothetical protein